MDSTRGSSLLNSRVTAVTSVVMPLQVENVRCKKPCHYRKRPVHLDASTTSNSLRRSYSQHASHLQILLVLHTCCFFPATATSLVRPESEIPLTLNRPERPLPAPPWIPTDPTRSARTTCISLLIQLSSPAATPC